MSEPVEPILIDLATVAALLAISKPTAERLLASHRMPAGVRLGRCLRFRRDVIERWVNAGCPDRKTFEAMEARRRK